MNWKWMVKCKECGKDLGNGIRPDGLVANTCDECFEELFPDVG